MGSTLYGNKFAMDTSKVPPPSESTSYAVTCRLPVYCLNLYGPIARILFFPGYFYRCRTHWPSRNA